MGEVVVFLSVAQAITQLVEQAFQILGRLRTAHQRQKALVGVLTRHQNELKSLKDIVKIIKKYHDLQTLSVAAELVQLQNIQQKLAGFLTTLDPQPKSKANQLMRQLVHGSADEKNLATIMDELVHLKTTLLLNIQTANVGVTRTIGQDVVANTVVIQRIDESLRRHIHDCEGLKIAQLLQGRRPSNDGFVPLTADDLKALSNDGGSSSDSENSLGETLVDDLETSARHSPPKIEREISRNSARDAAFQVNSAIGEDTWKNVDRVVIEDNVAENLSTQFNYAMSLEVALALMCQRQTNTGNLSKSER